MSKMAKNCVNSGGSWTHEFAIFTKKNLHRLTKFVTLKSIFVNNLSLAIVRIPLMANPLNCPRGLWMTPNFLICFSSHNKGQDRFGKPL